MRLFDILPFERGAAIAKLSSIPPEMWAWPLPLTRARADALRLLPMAPPERACLSWLVFQNARYLSLLCRPAHQKPSRRQIAQINLREIDLDAVHDAMLGDGPVGWGGFKRTEAHKVVARWLCGLDWTKEEKRAAMVAVFLLLRRAPDTAKLTGAALRRATRDALGPFYEVLRFMVEQGGAPAFLAPLKHVMSSGRTVGRVADALPPQIGAPTWPDIHFDLQRMYGIGAAPQPVVKVEQAAVDYTEQHANDIWRLQSNAADAAASKLGYQLRDCYAQAGGMGDEESLTALREMPELDWTDEELVAAHLYLYVFRVIRSWAGGATDFWGYPQNTKDRRGFWRRAFVATLATLITRRNRIHRKLGLSSHPSWHHEPAISHYGWGFLRPAKLARGVSFAKWAARSVLTVTRRFNGSTRPAALRDACAEWLVERLLPASGIRFEHPAGWTRDPHKSDAHRWEYKHDIAALTSVMTELSVDIEGDILPAVAAYLGSVIEPLNGAKRDNKRDKKHAVPAEMGRGATRSRAAVAGKQTIKEKLAALQQRSTAAPAGPLEDEDQEVDPETIRAARAAWEASQRPEEGSTP